MFFLPLCLDVLTDHFDRSSAGTQEAEALTPEHFLPELLPDLRILFFDQTAAGTFIGIDKFTEFRLRMGTEHDMDMVLIVIPLFQGDLGAIYSKISRARSEIGSFRTFFRYFTTRIR